MEIVRDGAVTLTVDEEATRRLYADRSSADNCKCRGCVWFAENHHNAFPPQFYELLARLGIDESLANEVITYGGDDEPPVFVEGRIRFRWKL